ncbi:uncharacterized protein J7T54_005393 [Emericellopsis cladophorae]|uniref:Gem-associated protein 5 TPR domain-containing protein n=1 Tax=Emericellopsis cladophorae TaxID=2686198 RepID=A0A9Q0BCZ5_9HYPO|nr:uncharacterized protein J7T54_005393 [Emericellopsis cladophorae]KAI6780291.1 hypothetical protein J7T54_005393 [Emericellopsis cladophorae]
MSAPAAPRKRAVSMSSGRSNGSRQAQAQEFSTMPSTQELRCFDPCAATGSMFLYAQGTSISEHGSGRYVVSYDAGQTAIVWDLMTGDEITRFASYGYLTAVAWMRNGNIAFGNSQGSIVLFEPQTSEHISTRTLDQIAVTALAPSADCRTFAIGYQNGSLLIATLQPRFTILHNLTTSRSPSPIVTLSWHASSSRQKSDMLSTQTYNGDLRVWSVAKSYNADDPAKVVRILKRSENMSEGPNWMGWSKNGRIIQYSDSQTLSWDVRTKHVTSDDIPTLEHVKGLAVWGPGASLFTLGPNNTVQQFDLNSPSIMVANVQHPANLLPPSPPNSIEEPTDKSAHSTTTIHTSESESSSIPLEMGVSESDEDQMPPMARFQRQLAHDSGSETPYGAASPVSNRSGLTSNSMSSAGSGTPRRYPGSLRSRGMSERTYISAGTSLKSSTIGRNQPEADIDSYSMGYSMGTTSTSIATGSSTRSRQRPSRLRNEVPRSPDASKVHDLFKFTRARLSDLAYKHPTQLDKSRLTNDNLSRQMLSTIFGWHDTADALIRDEMARHPTGSPSRILLAKWLGDMDTDILAASTENMTSSDWMLLALSGFGGHSSQHKLGRTYVQKLLESGDVHVAVTIMLGMGDHNDAIEVYVSHRRYMEALILACLIFPSVWERQAAIIRKWGEWAVQHRQQQLAIRCFACTDQEPTEMWTSPSATQLNFQSMNPSIPEVLSPPLSPPGVQRGPQRSIAKTSALKLITTFGDQPKKSKFYLHGDDVQTPIAAAQTPIAESAVSPGGTHEAATAVLRPSNNSRFNTPTSARPRNRLPSIGEMPSNLNRDELRANVPPPPPPAPADVHGHMRRASSGQDNLATGKALHRAATASPMMMRERSKGMMQDHGERPPPPNQDFMAKVRDIRANRRNGSRDRIPLGLNLELHAPAVNQYEQEVTSPDHSAASSTRYHWPTRRRGAGSVASSVTSNSSAGRSLRHGARQRDDYIHSLDAAQRYPKKRGAHSKERNASRGRHGSHSRERMPVSRDQSEDRGRGAIQTWAKPKRSPTSPIPMSPEDLAILSTPRVSEAGDPMTVRKASNSISFKPKATKSRNSSRGGSRSRRQSPEGRQRPQLAIDTRGRSKGRDGSLSRPRSPSSPVPMSATAASHYQGSEDEEDYKKAIKAQEEFRARHNGSRGPMSPAVSRRENADARQRDASEARDILPPLQTVRANSTEHAGDLRRMKEERQRKKEQAAKELEERRKSLAQRSRTPSIPHPSQYSPAFPRVGVEMSEPNEEHLPPRCATEPPKSMYARGPHIGLPATPKAMRLVVESDHSSGHENGNRHQQGAQQQPAATESEPAVPPIPATFAQRRTPKASPSNSPDKEKGKEKEKEESLLTLLPSTVYQPPTRPFIPRSMSAPIPDDPPSTKHGRKGSVGELRGIDEVIGVPGRRRSQEEALVPPPPPPAPSGPPPPMLRELQHLASPPPPPPAPLPHAKRAPGSGAALPAGTIEIVMDEDETSAPDDGVASGPAPPAPSFKGHSRGRSETGSLSGRFSKATERLRSASRGRKDRGMKSPPTEAPYESVPMPFHVKTPGPPPVHYDPDVIRSPVEGPRMSHMSTGLHKSEMF